MALKRTTRFPPSLLCKGIRRFSSLYAPLSTPRSPFKMRRPPLHVHITQSPHLRYLSTTLHISTCKNFLITPTSPPTEFGGDVPFCHVRLDVVFNAVSLNYCRGSHSDLLINSECGPSVECCWKLSLTNEACAHMLDAQSKKWRYATSRRSRERAKRASAQTKQFASALR